MGRGAALLVAGIGGDDGGRVGSDVDEEAMMSEVFVAAGRVELSTEAEMDGPSDAITITMEVETCTTVVGVGVFPMSEAGALTMNVVVPVVRKVGPSWPSSNSLSAKLGRNGWACPAPGEGGPKSSRMSTFRSGCRFSG